MATVRSHCRLENIVRTCGTSLAHLKSTKDTFEICAPPLGASVGEAAEEERGPQAAGSTPPTETAAFNAARSADQESGSVHAASSATVLAANAAVCTALLEDSGQQEAAEQGGKTRQICNLAQQECPVLHTPFASNRCAALIPCGHVLSLRYAYASSHLSAACKGKSLVLVRLWVFCLQLVSPDARQWRGDVLTMLQCLQCHQDADTWSKGHGRCRRHTVSSVQRAMPSSL